MSTFYRALDEALTQGEPAALAILTHVRGSSPQKLGAKALFYADGRIVGTMGGGCLEAEVQERARRALLTGEPAAFDLVLDHDFGWDDGLICGGRVQGIILPDFRAGAAIWPELARREQMNSWGVDDTHRIVILDRFDAPTPPADDAHFNGSATGKDAPYSSGWLYRETVTPPFALWIAGAGHIAQAVAPMAAALDFAVTIFDDRAALANHTIFAKSVALRVGAWDEILADPLPPQGAFGLIVTRGHRHDALVLRDWINRRFLFLGMIGSKRKARTIRGHFVEEKIAGEAAVAAVACPVGLDIGATSVPEIAVSIVAQYIQERAAYVAPHPSPLVA